MRLGERRQMTDGPRNYVAIAVEVAIAPAARTENARDVTRNGGFFGEHGGGTGFRLRHLQLSVYWKRRSLPLISDAVFHVGAPVVVAPDLLRRLAGTGDEDAEGVTRNVDQPVADTIAALAHSHPHRSGSSRGGVPASLLASLPKRTHREMFESWRATEGGLLAHKRA
jgi:hypothetical protein